MSAPTFGDRVQGAIAAHGHLCVGIDPHPNLLEAWGLPVSADGVRRFGERVVDAAAGRAGIVKPQVSFFERFGSAGFAALEAVLSAARERGLITIADAKRGDIGTTMDAYAAAWLLPGSPLEADALTVSPYLGAGALEGTLALAAAHGKGVFVLAATSNPEGAALQGAAVSGREGTRDTVAGRIVREVTAFNAAHTPAGSWAGAGFVVGATVDRRAAGLPDTIDPVAPILAPGFGHQGARPEDLEEIFGPLSPAVLASESRSILSAGPKALEAVIEATRARTGGARG